MPARRGARALAAGAGQVRRGRAGGGARRCSRSRSRVRWTRSSARGRSGCAGRSRSPAGAAATPPPLLLEAARRLEPLDAGLARETYLEALGAADLRRPPRQRRGDARVAAAARAAPAATATRRAPSTSCSTAWRSGSPTATPPALRRCGERSHVLRARQDRREADLRWLWLAWRARDRAVGRRDLDAIDDPRGRSSLATPGRWPAADRAVVPRGGAHVRRRVRLRGGAGRGGTTRSPWPTGNDPLGYASPRGRRLPRRRSRGAALHRCHHRRRGRTRRGQGDRRSPTTRGRCSTTASVATRRRSRPPSGPASTRISGWRTGRSPSSSRRPCGWATATSRRRRCGGSRNERRPAAPTGRSASRPGHARW